MTSRLADGGATAVDDVNDTGATRTGTSGADATARPPLRIHLGRDRHLEVDYRRTAIAAGALGLGVLAYKGVTARLTRRRDDARPRARPEARPFPRDDETRTAPAATMPPPNAALVGTDTGAEFVGEPASRQPDAPFVAASDDDDTAGLLVEVTEIEVVAVTPVGAPADRAVTGSTANLGAGADRSALTPEHVPTDLMGDAPPGAGDRAIDAFRPDATAPVPPEMRESLRPATGPATGFAGNRGDFASGLSQADRSK